MVGRQTRSHASTSTGERSAPLPHYALSPLSPTPVLCAISAISYAPRMVNGGNPTRASRLSAVLIYRVCHSTRRESRALHCVRRRGFR
eukprot:3493089-Rhodomonas_salina.2